MIWGIDAEVFGAWAQVAGDGQTAGVEVKGFPGCGYADPARAGEVKRTSPSTQAGTVSQP